MGKFIYTACQHGGDTSDVYKWMADDLGVALPSGGDRLPERELLYTAFLAKHDSDDEFQANHERFVHALKCRKA
ncbi:hypothetical protein AB595_10930 [Massilia sp. WF1]|uniref:hypothetical protein n=1 Tax=unclassified Massilia TaxID=2609279 RepID=UPI0006493A0A|nr:MULTISPECIES: hypothetical protein [unclassified Massilia]ALK96251.1 hypothetical protein AM586_08120 [Massilia sp. WG5]KLU36900.1 hypothetical protein AB595_10930 [Massilia sp. WF1]